MPATRPSDEALEIRREVDALERRLYELRSRLSVWEPLSGSLDLVECQAGEDRLGIELLRIERVVAVAALAPIPEAPAWAPGLLQVRGAAIPVIDVTARIMRAARAIELSDLIVICEAKGGRVGLLVEAVHGAVRIDAGEIRTPAEDMRQAPYVRGSFVTDGRVTHVVDLDSFVAFSGVALEA